MYKIKSKDIIESKNTKINSPDYWVVPRSTQAA